MPRLLLRSDSSPQGPGECEFTESGGFIGRGGDCTWVLDCPERLVSRRHAQIIFENNRFWIEDSSANGVYWNGADEPMGKGNRIAISDGDSFRMGSFQIEAVLAADVRSSAPPAAVTSVSVAPAVAVPIDLPAENPPIMPRSGEKPPRSAISALRLADTTDAFRPPARIPDDWEIELRPTAEREVPALVVNRRLNALQHAASQALLADLFLQDQDMVDADLSPEAAAAIGKSLRLCLELIWSLRAEFDRVDARLTGKGSDESGDSVRDIERFMRGLLHDDQWLHRMSDLQQLAAHLRGRHVALHDSYTESLTTIVDQFQPEKFEERMAAAHRDGQWFRRLLDRLFPAQRLWRFYRNWHEQQQSSDYRAVHQLFEKKLLSVYRRLNKVRHQEPQESPIVASGEKTAVSAVK